jgi:Beige/BEACH domain
VTAGCTDFFCLDQRSPVITFKSTAIFSCAISSTLFPFCSLHIHLVPFLRPYSLISLPACLAIVLLVTNTHAHTHTRTHTHTHTHRLQPFSNMAVALQGGHFDKPDRLFLSIEQSWLSASSMNLQVWWTPYRARNRTYCLWMLLLEFRTNHYLNHTMHDIIIAV